MTCSFKDLESLLKIEGQSFHTLRLMSHCFDMVWMLSVKFCLWDLKKRRRRKKRRYDYLKVGEELVNFGWESLHRNLVKCIHAVFSNVDGGGSLWHNALNLLWFLTRLFAIVVEKLLIMHCSCSSYFVFTAEGAMCVHVCLFHFPGINWEWKTTGFVSLAGMCIVFVVLLFSPSLCVHMRACVCVCACARMCMYVCLCVCVCMCVCVCARVCDDRSLLCNGLCAPIWRNST